MEFNPTVLTVNGVKMPLESAPDRLALVVVDNDIKLPPRTAVSGGGRLVIKEEVRGGVIQLIPVEEYSHEKDKVALCETVVHVAEVVPIILANQTNETMKVKQGKRWERL